MKINRIVTETVAFTFATVMSCGPSQIFGVVKGIIDQIRLFTCLNKQRKWEDQLKMIKWIVEEVDDLNGTNQASTKKAISIAKEFGIVQKLRIQEKDINKEIVNKYLEAKIKKNTEKMNHLNRQLKADLYALIPCVGAHLSWRVATSYKGKKFSAIFSRSVQQLFEPCQSACSGVFFMGRYGKEYDCYLPGRKNLQIQVATSTRQRYIDSFFQSTSENESNEDALKNRATVVLFHPSVGSAASMAGISHLYKEKGYNVLAVTIGGYPGSSRVTTSEKTVLQDIEAIKLFLASKGCTQVAFHGWSMGSGFAIHAGAGENPDHMKTLFIVADKPYTSPKEIGSNLLGPVGKGFMNAALPKNQSVELPNGQWTKTTGLDNLKQVEKLKEQNIPLVCIEAEKDFLMGRDRRSGIYQENFAKDLLRARYEEDEFTNHLLTVPGGHFVPLNGSEDLLSQIPSATDQVA